MQNEKKNLAGNPTPSIGGIQTKNGMAHFCLLTCHLYTHNLDQELLV